MYVTMRMERSEVRGQTVSWFSTVCNSSSSGSNTLFWPPKSLSHTCTHARAHTMHTHMHKHTPHLFHKGKVGLTIACELEIL